MGFCKVPDACGLKPLFTSGSLFPKTALTPLAWFRVTLRPGRYSQALGASGINNWAGDRLRP
jgi:hypothetical protein